MEDFRIFADAEAVAQAAAKFLSDQIATCVNTKGICHIALPGGSTPARCLELLSSKDLPWNNIHWYLSDERCYPQAHPERNDSMIDQNFWSRIETPAENLHPIPAELGAEPAAKKYSELINQIDCLDIVVLGMGEDGHTASLFPGNPDSPKPPPQRVSLGLTTIQSARQRIVLVSGRGKHEALVRIKQGVQLPVSRIGATHWFVDEAAAYNNKQGH